MNQIAIIAPSDHIADQFRNYVDEAGHDIAVYAGVLDDAYQIAKRLIDQGTEIIISRSGNSEYLKERLDIPVISCELALGDFLESLVLEMKTGKPRRKVALFWFGQYLNRFKEIDVLSKALRIEINQYTFMDFSEAEIVVKQAVADGVDFGFGGVVTGHYAKIHGLEYSLINTTKENLLKAIGTAEQVLLIQAEERRKSDEYRRISEIYNVIMDFSYNGILGIDRELNINIFNHVAEDIFGLVAEDVIGHNIYEIFPNSNLPEVIDTGEIEKNRLMYLKGVEILVNKIPISGSRKIIGAISTFQDVKRLQENEVDVRRKLHRKGLYAKYTFDDIRGSSEIIQKTIRIAKKYAQSESTILIRGETGTGKELFAQSIHNHSKRQNRPFVAVNCASLPENLLESELFGYESGAFTGGLKEGKKGLFEIAHQGTIFLDEIGELPKAVQAKLLRVLQEKEIRRIGSDSIIPVDVRVITATNRDLMKEIEEKRFREDLFYRINILNLVLPNLHERGDDVREISRNFLKLMHGKSYEKHYDKWEAIIDGIAGMRLRGNIRELINILERQSTVIEIDDITLFAGTPDPLRQVSPMSCDEAERVLSLLHEYHWNKQRVAKELGISRTTLWRKMKQYRITE